MTNCNKEVVKFQPIKNHIVEARFAEETVTSDGGVLLLREIDKKLKLTEQLVKFVPDDRDQTRIQHSMLSILQQRIYGLALGYEDLNDHTTLRNDPAIQTAVDRFESLASASTLCRVENKADRKFAFSANKLLVDMFIASFEHSPQELILDFDATEDEVHGKQENRFFHGFYDCYCFLPLHVFCGSQLLVSYLRPSNIDGAKHTWAILSLLVKYMRKKWPRVKIIFRGDSGFCRHKMLTWCEKNNVSYIVGIAKNKRLSALTDELQKQAKQQFKDTQVTQRLFSEIQYAAKTWDKKRRTIIKAEHMEQGGNPRFILVHGLNQSAQELYEKIYCARGDMENRIKELKSGLSSDRTSCHKWWANQFRVILSSMAYILMESTRRLALKNTELAQAQCSTIRLALYKIGAMVTRNTRRIIFLLSSHYPKQNLFCSIAKQLCVPSS